MKKSQVNENDKDLKIYLRLIEVIRDNRDIRMRVTQLLRMPSYQRRMLLNNWLEQLRRQQAPDQLRQALSCLFDDAVAEKTLKLIDDKK